MIDEDDDKEKLFGGDQNYNVARMIALTMQLTKLPFRKKTNWLEDPLLFDAVSKAILELLKHLRPEGSASDQSVQSEAMAEFVAEQVPAALWKAVQEANPSLSLLEGTVEDHRAGVLKADLGALADRPRPTILGADDLKARADRIQSERSSSRKGRGTKS